MAWIRESLSHLSISRHSIYWPSRITVTQSHSSNSSSSLWETNRIAIPLLFSSRQVRISWPTSFSDRDDVGSSMMMHFASMRTAFAISIICWTPMPKDPAGFLTSTSWPRDFITSYAFLCIVG